MISVSVVRTARVEIQHRAVYRYLGYGHAEPDEHTCKLIDCCIEEVNAIASYQACWGMIPVAVSDREVDLSIMKVKSKDLSRNLRECKEAILFAATLGAGADQLRQRTEIISPAKALVLDAVVTAGVEAWCDELCCDVRVRFSEQGLKLRPRFSPGYGDLSLSLQGPLLEALRSSSRIGVSLTKAQLMLPQKSVSAIIGLSPEGCEEGEHDCSLCTKKNCSFRLI